MHDNSGDMQKKCMIQQWNAIHTIFAALAGCVLVVFVLLPTILLILYPTRLFNTMNVILQYMISASFSYFYVKVTSIKEM